MLRPRFCPTLTTFVKGVGQNRFSGSHEVSVVWPECALERRVSGLLGSP